jgi:hypothetical protein
MAEIDVRDLKKSVFNTLYEIDTRERSVKKDTGRTQLNYLPWATTYSEVCKHFNDVEYEFLTNTETTEIKTIKKVDENTTIETTKSITQEIPYTVTEAGLEVNTKITINGITKTMRLPVYDSSFRSMKLEPYEYKTKNGGGTVPAATIADIYKSIMRCFAKNLSMFGVGLNYWTKEDAPESVLQMNKLQAECMELIKKKVGISDNAKAKVEELCKNADESANGDPRLIENVEVLETLKKALMAVRK